MINSFPEMFSSASPMGTIYKFFPFPAARPSIPHRLAAFQDALYALQSFLFPAETDKGLAFEVQKVLLADERGLAQIAATHDIGQFFGYYHIVVGGILAPPHGMDAGIQRPQSGATQHFDILSGYRHRIT